MLLTKKMTAPTIIKISRSRRVSAIHLIVFALIALCAPRESSAQEKKRATQPAKTEALVTVEEAARLEAVITTDAGVIRFEFLADKAPRHVQQFVKRCARRIL